MSVFHWEPDYVYTEVTGYKNNIIEYESGKERRMLKHAYARRTWTLSFPNVPKVHVTDIESFFKLHHGAHNTFNWTNPIDNITYVARFADDSLNFTRVSDDVYNITCKLFEVND